MKNFNWMPFEEARVIIQNLGISSQMEWYKCAKRGNLPENIPTAPHNSYKNHGWTNWYDWLGKPTPKQKWLSYNKAKKFIHSLNLASQSEWKKYLKHNKLPENIPRNPSLVYRGKGWINWYDWLGNTPLSEKWMSFEKAREYARSLELKSHKEWFNHIKKEVIKNIPAYPHIVYKNKGWIGWYDWLGNAPVGERWIPFEEARDYARSLKLYSRREWLEYCKSGKKPKNIPQAPISVYKNEGWAGWHDWLGKQWLPFEKARKYIHELSFTSKNEWLEYCKSGKKPKNIPHNAPKVYHAKWISWQDWLGYKNIEWMPFEEAHKLALSLRLTSYKAWIKYCKSGNLPKNIPKYPHSIYKNKGWQSYHHWLGYEKKLNTTNTSWMPFIEAKKYVHALKFTSREEWKHYCKNGNLIKKIPIHPQATYKNNGWSGWQDWLGYKTIEWLPFEEARKYVQNLKLRSSVEWRKYIESGKLPNNIPKSPMNTYRNKGWIDLRDWLGYSWLPFTEARENVRKLKLKSQEEWKNYCKSGKLPKSIPTCPEEMYKNSGWINTADWLGYSWLPFKKARRYIHSLKLSSQTEWKKLIKLGKLPDNIPHTPHNVYKNSGWIDWYDWLGKPRHNFVTFKKARRKITSMNITCEEEWFELCKKDQIPDDIPVNPHIVYEKEGWLSWYDWLGT